MNGSVPSMTDLNKHSVITKKIEDLTRIFYFGEPLTALELDIQRIYLDNKYKKNNKYEQRKARRFKVKWTVSDLNRY